jgi:hypothetical protein
MLTPPSAMRVAGSGLGKACGLGEKTICTNWSRAKLMPIVASSGAMRA